MELTLFLNHACNLRCSYCYTGRKLARPMSLETAKQAIDFILARDPTELTLSFFGGEPLLEFELLKRATEYARARLAELSPAAELSLSLNTNATLVDAEVAAFVRAQPSLAAFVSLDGREAVHDRHRFDGHGHGSYQAVRRGIGLLADAGARVAVLAVVNPDTADSLGDTVEELLSLPAFRAHLVCNLRSNWDDAALNALRAGLIGAAKAWSNAFRAGKQIVVEPLTTKILSYLHAAMPCSSRCQLAAHELVVAPSGRIYSCGELVTEDEDQRYAIGHISSGLDLPKLERLREERSRIDASCDDCSIQERCSSACGCKHVALTGSFGAVTSTLCDTEAAFIEAADQVAEQLYAERCEAFLQMFYRQRWAAAAPPTLVKLRTRRSEMPE